MSKQRITVLYIIFIILCAFLLLRLFSLSGAGFSPALSGQYTRKIQVASRRGIIFDRYGEPLSFTQDKYITLITPAKIEDIPKASKLLFESSELLQSEIIEKIARGTPFKIITDIPICADYAHCYKLYDKNTSPFLCHILGYLNAEGKGVCAIEKEYDYFLSNTASGKVTFTYESDAKSGQMQNGAHKITDDRYSEQNGICTTIDSSLQSILENVCDKNIDMGAAVVCEIESGNILALCSRPSFSQNDLAKYLTSENGEFLNRAFLPFTPGSVFKIIVAAASLELSLESYEQEYVCEGFIDVHGEIFNCHETSGHGAQTMCDAFKNSCNTYFIDLALKVGPERIIECAKRFGIGSFESVDLLKTSSGVLPSCENTVPAMIANTSIGQGEILITPLEAINIIRAASTGKIYEPQIISKFVLGEEYIYPEKKLSKNVLDKNICALLKKMLEECVNDGTGKGAKSDIVSIAGKTATAQSGQTKHGKEVIHKWFAGYFPAEDPKYAAVFLADGNGNRGAVSVAFREFAESVYADSDH